MGARIGRHSASGLVGWDCETGAGRRLDELRLTGQIVPVHLCAIVSVAVGSVRVTTSVMRFCRVGWRRDIRGGARFGAGDFAQQAVGDAVEVARLVLECVGSVADREVDWNARDC